MKNLYKCKDGCGIFVELWKDSHIVGHNTLLAKLEHYGIPGTRNDWFKSYLFDRRQFVSICGSY